MFAIAIRHHTSIVTFLKVKYSHFAIRCQTWEYRSVGVLMQILVSHVGVASATLYVGIAQLRQLNRSVLCKQRFLRTLNPSAFVQMSFLQFQGEQSPTIEIIARRVIYVNDSQNCSLCDVSSVLNDISQLLIGQQIFISLVFYSEEHYI